MTKRIVAFRNSANAPTNARKKFDFGPYGNCSVERHGELRESRRSSVLRCGISSFCLFDTMTSFNLRFNDTMRKEAVVKLP
jgi:hypothetical protein